MELAQAGTEAGAPAVDLQLADGAAPTGEGDASHSGQAVLPSKPGDKTAAAETSKTEEQKAAEAALVAAKGEAGRPRRRGGGRQARSMLLANGQVLENGGPILTSGTMPVAPIEPKKKSFLSSFFGSTPAKPIRRTNPSRPAAAREAKAKPIITLPEAPDEDKRRRRRPSVSLRSAPRTTASTTVPAISRCRACARPTSSRSSASPASTTTATSTSTRTKADRTTWPRRGLARLAPNGLLKQRESVDTACLKPKLVRMLKAVERHFGKRLVVTSGYRSPSYNKKVRGAEKSQHMYCAAVDVQLPGVSKWELAKYVRAMPGRGGVGTYCHGSIHIDVGPERDWNWKCGRRKA